jgi:DNA-binding phage protein
MPLRDHNEILLDCLDSEEAIKVYLDEAIELAHPDYLRHAEANVKEATERLAARRELAGSLRKVV